MVYTVTNDKDWTVNEVHRNIGPSEVVKGCKMPARSRRPVSLPENSPGRRLTSLKGGNRGRQPQGYGDLIVGPAAAAAKAAE